MDAQNALFDGIEMELRPIHDFYFNTASFRDLRQSGAQREWGYFIDLINRREWESGRIIRSLRDGFIHRVQSLLHPGIDSLDSPYGSEERERILRERRMVLQDCMDCLRTVRSVTDALLDVPPGTYQENKPVCVVEFSDEHIPSIKLMEELTYDKGINGTRLAEMFHRMKERNKLFDRHGKPHPLHFSVAVHPSKQRQVYGYLFTESVPPSDCEIHSYRTFHGTFEEPRKLTKIITMACQPEATARAVPELLADALEHMQKRQGERFENHTNKYHQEA